MSITDRITMLQEERSLTNKDVEIGAGLANASISQWKKGKGKPSLESIVKLATYFEVTTDYLLCLSDNRSCAVIEKSLSEEEELLLKAFHSANASGRFRIIQVCMNEQDAAEKGESVNAG